MAQRNFFPLGDMAFVSFEDTPITIRETNRIFVGDKEYTFHTVELAMEAISQLWHMYDEEQLLRNKEKDQLPL